MMPPRFKSATSKEEKLPIVNTLIREMAVHSDAEEVSLYNEFAVLGLAETAEHNKEEHSEVKKLVYEADNASIDDPNFDDKMTIAVTTFLEHSEEEENEQLPQMAAQITREQSDAIAREFLKARMLVPTRAHPDVPQTGGIVQQAIGVHAKIHDKLSETLAGRKFVDVKYAHPEL
ncbi:hypothetical protein E1B28_010462 [Marasmius oreades]|uniref:Hemerythrin-like domain-containing protein n=1 Tax=Marasmius oreades TaxID=181124 RepID=A0A9P7RXB1_9AGAR|nr:uncharacterized protein E1B28_010462 [Marasmius oreades]KAG7091425.1 hypothetical protein E1B28_010462 [Marasmius oreades]